MKAIGVSRKQLNIQVFWNVELESVEDGGKYSVSKCREMPTQLYIQKQTSFSGPHIYNIFGKLFAKQKI